MRDRLRFIAMAVLFTLASVRATGAATPIFLLDSDVPGPTVLFQVDPTNGQLTMLGTVSSGPGEALGLAAGRILAEVFAVLVELADGVAFAEGLRDADGVALGEALALAPGTGVLVAP